ncbi:zinc finger protein ZFP2-like [Galleria mellonella]|uniref:Zinc finger protein ZFP2-like n=1 Tax=Galleria mellonella TaxID=7137 RepID=A0ABM3MPG1_GALME|nr:zinc finger protein ZFP2-like [Galleria mellonella]
MAESTKTQCCLGCLSRSDEVLLGSYNLQNETLKVVLQMDSICLCHLCKRIAQHTELFIQNVQSNQILLENFPNVMDTAFQIVRSQTQPLVNLSHFPLDIIHLEGIDRDIEESFVTYNYNESKGVEIKMEMKEEESVLLDHLEGEFIDNDTEFQASFLKEEDEDFPLKLELADINLKCLKKTLKKSKVRKKQNTKQELLKRKNIRIKTLYISREQCMEERAKMMKDIKYLNSMYKCENCIKGFNFKGSYDKHMEKHSQSMGEFECDICKQRMPSEEKLLSHKRYHQLRYKCSECGLTRISRLTIKDHYTAYHCYGYYQYNCPHCSKIFKRQVSLRKHISYSHTNKERVSCAYCHKSYVNKEVLKGHMIMRHPKEVAGGEVHKKYVCQECGMAFKAPSHLKNHSIKHSHRRDYYCVECDKSFKSNSSLKQHLKTAAPHINYIELPLPCLHCEKRFAIRRDLERHTNRVHLNIKPFQCDRCDKAYVNGWSLNEHKRMIHEGYKRPLKFPCPMCDKVFDRNQILKGHIRTHTGERPYQCSRCPAQFSQASILGTHVKLIHLKLTRDGRPKVAMK